VNVYFSKEGSRFVKTLLITPKATKGWPNYAPPIGLCYLKACLKRAGFADTTVLDLASTPVAEGEPIIRERAPDIVGLTCFTETRAHTFQTAQIVKKINPQTKVILGGVHATLMHRQIMEHYPFVDIICIGESEETLIELFQALSAGKDLRDVRGITYRQDGQVVLNAARPAPQNLDEIPFPDYGDLDLEIYKEPYPFAKNRPRATVITSRGCPFSCIYCAPRAVWRTWRPRSAGNVLDEIEWYVERGFFAFSIADDLFTLNQERTREICQGIIDRKLHIGWSAQTRVDCVSEETIKLIKEAGCEVLQFGVESGSPQILKNLNKREKIEDVIKAFDCCKKFGIKTQFNVIVGSPGETRQTIEQTKELIRRTRPDYLGANILRIFPQSPLMEMAREEGLVDDDFFLTDEEYVYYTGAMKAGEMNAILRELYLLHAGQMGVRGYLQLLDRAWAELRQNPGKLLLSLAPWR
jgi:anaerobic magnesium-protoporphyrin IX monomethyl ester cyclase